MEMDCNTGVHGSLHKSSYSNKIGIINKKSRTTVTMPAKTQGRKIHISGIVQGVGFRPFIYSSAKHHQLTGWVRNTSAGVDIEVEGKHTSIQAFIHDINTKFPPLAAINSLLISEKEPQGYSEFQILESTPIPGEFIPISPDVGLCEDCYKELIDPSNRRYLYPFINCTNCGPRYTIINDIPYDRPLTTMAGFPMCPACTAEYNDPLNRRFHAQPTACSDCGPWIWIETLDFSDNKNQKKQSTDLVLTEAHRRLNSGQILAIKGLGGFHLACNAQDERVVSLLRERKQRVDKPFAVMMPDFETIKQHCYLSEGERIALLSHEKPIVILKRKKISTIAASIAPNQDTIGVMLPYTPLHHLLFQTLNGNDLTPLALVMTSGNLSDEPIAVDNDEAHQKLASLADAFLLHNRPIQTRCDDSVTRMIKSSNETEYLHFIRRARGYTPRPIELIWDSVPTLAVGGELKNTFCLTRQRYAFPSQYIGDMQNYETLQWFESSISHLQHLLRIQPQLLACDKHPDYLSTRYAHDRATQTQTPLIEVQHHHAHIASVMVENQHPQGIPVIGLAFDGTGYGDDGNIWGGEFFIATYQSYQRLFHLEYMPLPGGDISTKSPARIALAYLFQSGIDWYPELTCVNHFCPEDRIRLLAQLTHKINTPVTSSMGRLFDAVASLTGIRQTINYEAQAAIELEASAKQDEESSYPFTVNGNVISITPLLESVVYEVLSGIPGSVIAARFHNTVIQMVYQIVELINMKSSIKIVALSGGVWQNSHLLTRTIALLSKGGYTVLTHRRVPTNDGGISLGQAAIAHFSTQ
jgi:hydrogenase maturation protein HypF